MRVIASTNNGLVKVCDLAAVPSPQVVAKWGHQEKTREIDIIAPGCDDSDVFVAFGRGDVQRVNPYTGDIKDVQTEYSGRVRGMYMLNSSSLVTCTTNGVIEVRWFSNPDPIKIEDDDHVVTSNTSNSLDIKQENGDSAVQLKLQVDFALNKVAGEKHISRMRRSPHHANVLALGGREVELQLWDISAQKYTWLAKNVRNDFLDLRVPVWISDLAFDHKSPSNIFICSKYRHLRHYDTRVQRRPLFSVELGQDHPLTTLAAVPDGHTLIVADAIGTLSSFDIRTRRQSGAFRGAIGGSLKCIEHHPTEPVFASVGLDRYLRVHNSTTRALLYKVYLKQRLSWVLWASDTTRDVNNEGDTATDEIAKEIKEKEAASPTNADAQDDDERLWASFTTVTEHEGRGSDIEDREEVEAVMETPAAPKVHEKKKKKHKKIMQLHSNSAETEISLPKTSHVQPKAKSAIAAKDTARKPATLVISGSFADAGGESDDEAADQNSKKRKKATQKYREGVLAIGKRRKT